nr:MAG TPA: hypothetical protein [Caudoviricetes sp.]
MRCVGMRFFSVRLVLTQGNKKRTPECWLRTTTQRFISCRLTP